MGSDPQHTTVVVDGEPALVVDATAAALRGHGVEARVRQDGEDPDAGSLLILVPAGGEALLRALDTVGRHRLPWGAIVDGRADARGAATRDALREAGASWVLGADAGLPSVLAALAAVEGSADAADAAGAAEGGARIRAAAATAATPARRLASLTAEERAVLEAMAGGRSLGDTAQTLGSTVATVRAHRRSVRVKLGVRSQLAAVALLVRQQAEDGPDRERVSSGPATSALPRAQVPHLA